MGARNRAAGRKCSATAQLARRAGTRVFLLYWYKKVLALLVQKYAAELQDENAAQQRSLRVAVTVSALLLLGYSSLLLVFTGAKAHILTHCEKKKYKY